MVSEAKEFDMRKQEDVDRWFTVGSTNGDKGIW